jgi:hypothetical protein
MPHSRPRPRLPIELIANARLRGRNAQRVGFLTTQFSRADADGLKTPDGPFWQPLHKADTSSRSTPRADTHCFGIYAGVSPCLRRHIRTQGPLELFRTFIVGRLAVKRGRYCPGAIGEDAALFLVTSTHSSAGLTKLALKTRTHLGGLKRQRLHGFFERRCSTNSELPWCRCCPVAASTQPVDKCADELERRSADTDRVGASTGRGLGAATGSESSTV